MNMEQMNQVQKPEISIGDWVVTLLVAAIPLVGIIMMFVWAFGGNAHPSKANWAKAMLIWAAIIIGLTILFTILGISIIGSMFM